ncbi:ATP-dependent DNA ligase LigA [Halohasta salina]|uniref:ATP-dependent DNA ligase LigA n=1 Tax=Halohasta salina TaxID=2961621 RepID=UPI0020A311C8|nr:ATP-dependent DNA ligase LigA [Halohasta salina]
MEFEAFAERVDGIEAESGDIETIERVAALFETADAELPVVARFVQGRVFPAWSSRTLDIGPSLCYTAIARAAGPNVSADDIEARLADRGEIGAVAASYEFGDQQGLAAFGGGSISGLTVDDVDTDLRALAAADGSGSQDRKVDILFGLFRQCSRLEARYLARLVLGEMRIGVGEGTVRDAICEAFDQLPEAVARALQVTNDYGEVAAVAREEGQAGLDGLELDIGRPVQSMLAQAGTAAEALDSWEEAAAEVKFDGARVQIHVEAGEDGGLGEVSIYSRNMDDVTAALPDIVDVVRQSVTEPCILDGEVVAVDDAGDPLPFQHVLRRFRRKHDVDRMVEEVTLRLHAFDCLRAGSEGLLERPLVDRHRRLEALVTDDEAVADLLLSDDPDELAAFEAEALEAGHEGIMLKNPQSTYSPGDRGQNWLKRKPDVETVDLVVTGGEWGEGRRASFLGTFLLSVREPETNGYRTIGKVATGITDEKLAELTELLEPHITAESGQTVDIQPSVVFEVGYEEIQPSPTYSSGYALRFPRFVAVRPDKSPADCETVDRIERLAESQ